MKDMKGELHELHVLHGDLSFFVVPEGHDRYLKKIKIRKRLVE